MSIKRYIASADNTITNAFKSNLIDRGTGSNMGSADILEVFSIYAQATTSSREKSRVLVDFPVSQIIRDRNSGLLPASGSVAFVLKLYNAEHSNTLPKDFTCEIKPVTRAWEEGRGLDMEEYSDETYQGTGSNWVYASAGTTWTTEGGDYSANTALFTTASFVNGTENIEVDISEVVERWIANSLTPYGLGIALSSTLENDTNYSFYTKKFFSRSSEFFYRRPYIEARYDNSILDKRGDFYFSSSLVSGPENLQTLYLYNYHRGGLKNIPDVGTGSIYVRMFSSSAGVPSGGNLVLVSDGTYVRSAIPTVVTGGWVRTGVYSASFAMTASTVPYRELNDVWYGSDSGASPGTVYFTGSVVPVVFSGSNNYVSERYVTALTNLQPIYHKDDNARFRMFIRQKNWNPNIYNVATSQQRGYIVESGSYRIFRVIDELDVVPYGTGSTNHTRLSYDVSGNYFDFDMNLLEPGYAYAIKLAYYNGTLQNYAEQSETFKFRVE